MQVNIRYTRLETAGVRKKEINVSYYIDTDNENWKEKIKREFNDIVENENNLISISIGI